MAAVIKKIAKSIIPAVVWDSLHVGVGLVGAVLNGFPSRKMAVIGVTGTNGKSTVVQMLHEIFSSFGLNVASASTVRFRVKNEIVANTLKMTMPGRFALQKFLNRAAAAGCQYAILEVTSEGLKQHRDAFINFDGAGLNKVSPHPI